MQNVDIVWVCHYMKENNAAKLLTFLSSFNKMID